MQNPFLYPGRGLALRRVTASTGNVLTAPETTTIPNGGYSELIAAHDCLELMFEAVFAAAATGNFVVQEVIDQTASVAGEEFSNDALVAKRTHKWSAGGPLVGFFRILNSSGQDMTVYCQKRIN